MMLSMLLGIKLMVGIKVSLMYAFELALGFRCMKVTERWKEHIGFELHAWRHCQASL